MTNALSHARRVTRTLTDTTVSLGQALLTKAGRGLARAARAHADWSARSWSAHHGPRP